MADEHCPGNSIHECRECGEPFLCYACPDEMNPDYTSNMCEDCLTKWLDGVFEAMRSN